MRSVRCDACGTRALMAASKCPKCGHEIGVRDGFGEMLPLSHCSTCNSYYPERLGSCRWCGTTPQRAPVGPYVWKGVGVATFVAMAWGAWLVHDDPPAEVSQARLAAVLKPDSSAGSLDSALALAAIADSMAFDSTSRPDSTGVVASDSTIQSVAEVVAAISDSMTQPTSTGVVVDSAPAVNEPVAQNVPATQPETVPSRELASARETVATNAPVPTRESTALPDKGVVPRSASVPRAEPPRVAVSTRTPAPRPAPAKSRPARSANRTLARTPERTTARTPARASTKAVAKAPTAKAPAKSVAKTPTKTVTKAPAPTVAKAPARPRTTRVVWVNSVARNWVIVRASADRSGRVIASIGPNTRVQLGESRGGWRRVRAKGFAGWVDHRSFFAGVGSSRKVGSLAAQ